jgi:ABC-2 type transport system ATP-binding protein
MTQRRRPALAALIEIERLTKRFGAFTAVDDVSFSVERGEVVGFLGPNGAGKSTTMKMLAGFVTPTSGTARICGEDVVDHPVAAKRHLGYLPEGAPTYPEMTVGAFLGFVGRIRGYRGIELGERVEDAVRLTQLQGVRLQPIETLSKGFKRRVGLAQALLHDPPVLVLDEPTDGLDPNQKHEVRQLINGMAADKIIVISTHILEEVDAVCTRAIIIAAGRIVADEQPAALIARSRYHNAVTLRLAPGGDAQALALELRAVPGVASVEVRAGAVTAFPVAGAQVLTAIGDLAGSRGWALDRLELESGRLDEVFRTITTGTDAGTTAADATGRAA